MNQLVAGQLVDLVHRWNRAKYHSFSDKQKLEAYKRILADMKEAFEITDEKEFKRTNRVIWDVYDAIRYEMEELEDDIRFSI